MFTGIVRAMGAVKSNRLIGGDDGGRALVVDLGALMADSANPIRAGDSIAVNGACLTVAELRGVEARFDISPETLAACLVGEWAEGARLNLEPALTLQTPLGGHLVTGHVDAAGVLVSRTAAEGESGSENGGGFTNMEFEAPPTVGRLLANKGAVAVDGVSLTTNQVHDQHECTHFTVMLVPHTLENTTLGALRPGARVHLEADMLARYIQRLAECPDDARDTDKGETT